MERIIPISDPNALESSNPDTKNVIDACLSGFYTNKEGVKVPIQPGLNTCLINTKSYPPGYKFSFKKLPSGKRNECKISIHKESTVDSCYRHVVIEEKKNVCALNFANPFNPGGGFTSFARAQEETICRSSGLYYSIIQKPDYYEYNQKNYRGESSDYMIYSPECPVWKYKSYEFLPEPFYVSFITSAAVIKQMVDSTKIDVDGINDNRIRLILECAIENGVKHFILGSFGAGAFGNDANQIAKSFYKHLITENMQSYFETVTFATTGRSNSINIFSSVFHLPIIE